MGPEELAIIMSPQFINATFRAGEDWYHAMVARNQEIQRRNSFEAANAQYAIVNQQLLYRLRRQNDDWRRHAETIVQQSDERVSQEKRLYAKLLETYRVELYARRKNVSELKGMTALCSEKDAAITRLQTDLAGVRGSLGAAQEEIACERQSLVSVRDEGRKTPSALQAAQEALAHEQQSHASARDETARTQSALQAGQGDRDRLQDGLKKAEGAVSALEASQREAALVTQAVEAAGMTVMDVTAQAMEAWAGQGKPSMLDNLMT